MSSYARHSHYGSRVSIGPLFIAVGHINHWPLFVMAVIPAPAIRTPPHAYLDDSGCNPKRSDCFLWAGYVARLAFWQIFGDRWNRILDREPALPYWHQTDVRTRNRATSKTPFRFLSDAQAKQREESLCRLISENLDAMIPFAVRVAHADIRTHLTGKIVNPPGMSEMERDIVRPSVLEAPQFIATLYAAKFAVTLNEYGDLPISLHYEARADDPVPGNIKRVWDFLSASDPKHMGTLDFPVGKTRGTPHLQAADMIAWHMNRRIMRPDDPDDEMWPAVGGPRLGIHTITAANLKKHVATFNSFKPATEQGRPSAGILHRPW